MLKRLQQRLYRWIVPDSALSGWRVDPIPSYYVVAISQYGTSSISYWLETSEPLDVYVGGTTATVYINGIRIK